MTAQYTVLARVCTLLQLGHYLQISQDHLSIDVSTPIVTAHLNILKAKCTMAEALEVAYSSRRASTDGRLTIPDNLRRLLHTICDDMLASTEEWGQTTRIVGMSGQECPPERLRSAVLEHVRHRLRQDDMRSESTLLLGRVLHDFAATPALQQLVLSKLGSEPSDMALSHVIAEVLADAHGLWAAVRLSEQMRILAWFERSRYDC